jgi:N6-L-threonylcarbamoyladenine synthase
LDFVSAVLRRRFSIYQDQIKTDPEFIQKNMSDLCASHTECNCGSADGETPAGRFQTGIKEVAIAGGVSANQGLRRKY